jgi:hypothetical protein
MTTVDTSTTESGNIALHGSAARIPYRGKVESDEHPAQPPSMLQPILVPAALSPINPSFFPSAGRAEPVAERVIFPFNHHRNVPRAA